MNRRERRKRRHDGISNRVGSFLRYLCCLLFKSAVVQEKPSAIQWQPRLSMAPHIPNVCFILRLVRGRVGLSPNTPWSVAQTDGHGVSGDIRRCATGIAFTPTSCCTTQLIKIRYSLRVLRRAGVSNSISNFTLLTSNFLSPRLRYPPNSPSFYHQSPSQRVV